MPGDVIVNVFGRTDVGRVRDHNEDSFLVADLTADNASLQPEVRTHLVGSHGSLFMVADGLGGAAAGEVASELAILTVQSELRAQWRAAPERTAEVFARAIKAAAEAANAKIFAYAVEHPESRGLGTTATIAGLLGDTLYLAQVGDSRAYLVRNGVALQITKDQSLMQRLIEAGELTPEEAERSERRNIILQALGPEPTVKIDLTYQKVRRGDTLVLCTDGLSGLVRKGGDRGDPAGEQRRPAHRLQGAHRPRERERRSGQHHGDRRAIRRRGTGRAGGGGARGPRGVPSARILDARQRRASASLTGRRRRSAGGTPTRSPRQPRSPTSRTPIAPIATPRPMSARGRSILFLVAGILLAITVLLALRIYKTGVVHRAKPEPVQPAAPDTGIRA